MPRGTSTPAAKPNPFHRLTVCLKAYPEYESSIFQQPLEALLVNLLLGQKHFIYITPSPILSRLKRLHDGMLSLMKVFGCVLVLG